MTEFKRFIYAELLERMNHSSSFLQILTGPRQVGKTTLIQQLASTWDGAKILASADEVSPPNVEWIRFHWQRAREEKGLCLLALDEIQKIPGWSETVKTLFDQDRSKTNLRIILSGSASLSLQRGLTESLAGRYELLRCPHWGLDESTQAFGWDIRTYLKFGGYPAATELIGNSTRWQNFMRDSIIEPVLGRDLQALVNIQKPALLRQTFELVMAYPAQEISYQKLLGQLQNYGNAATIKNYLDLLEGAFLLLKLEKFALQVVRQKKSSPKILPLAPALIHAFTKPEEIDQNPEWYGRVFESAIGAHLSRIPGRLYYWRQQPFEVDFIHVEGRQITAIEVKSGRKKNQSGIMKFQALYPKAKCFILDLESGKDFLKKPASLENIR